MLDIKVTISIDSNLLRPNDNRIIIGSNEKKKSKHGWNLKYTIEESLKDMLHYWQSVDG
jgi:GDP-4-dehydro-6-deoxy-D-mannose reductase